MPVFRFRIPHPGTDRKKDHVFECQVESLQCTEHTKAGAQCRRRTVIGSPYCATHLKFNHHLTIKPSTIPGAGKGLFAINPLKTAKPNEIIFRQHERIVIYHGERITEEELLERYRDKTGPYAVVVSNADVKEKDREYEDGACTRCIGSIANTKTRYDQCNARLGKYQGEARLMAVKNIRNGQEIFCWYGEEYNLNEPGVQYGTYPK